MEINMIFNMKLFYILDEHKNVIPASYVEWIENRDKNKIIKQEEIDGYFISTVFLGIDHAIHLLNKIEPPLVFETMVFDKDKDAYGHGYGLYTDRYSTYQEAEIGHKKAVSWVKNGCKEDE